MTNDIDAQRQAVRDAQAAEGEAWTTMIDAGHTLNAAITQHQIRREALKTEANHLVKLLTAEVDHLG